MTDVNAQFAAERAEQLAAQADRKQWLEDQVAAGQMRKNRGGSYTMTTGIDTGEVFYASGLPQTGLETLESGEAAFYGAGQPAWWSLGTRIPPLAKTTTEILTYAGLNFDVGIRPTPWLTQDGEWNALPDSFTTYSTDPYTKKETPFGTVGKTYVPLPPREAFGVLDEISGYMPVETAGLWKGGRQMFVTCRAPEDLVLDPSGIADKVRMYLQLNNSWSGESSLTGLLTPWRTVCKNTNRFAARDATGKISIRHTRNLRDRLEVARQALGLTRDYFAEFAAEETTLIGVPFRTAQVNALIDQVYGELPSDAKDAAKRADKKRRDAVHNWWEVEVDRVGPTAYAAEQAITAYVDHDRSYRSLDKRGLTPLAAEGEALLAGEGDARKHTAHRKLMMLVKK